MSPGFYRANLAIAFAVGHDYNHARIDAFGLKRVQIECDQQIAGADKLARLNMAGEMAAAEFHGIDANVDQDFRASVTFQPQRVVGFKERLDAAINGERNLPPVG